MSITILNFALLKLSAFLSIAKVNIIIRTKKTFWVKNAQNNAKIEKEEQFKQLSLFFVILSWQTKYKSLATRVHYFDYIIPG